MNVKYNQLHNCNNYIQKEMFMDTNQYHLTKNFNRSKLMFNITY